jgi:serine/threonine protein kinase
MTIGQGSRIGPYEVTALLGEGGMGRVWRARHTLLKRDDALKVLPDAFSSDPRAIFWQSADRTGTPDEACVW